MICEFFLENLLLLLAKLKALPTGKISILELIELKIESRYS
jgi:hypothetical protein